MTKVEVFLKAERLFRQAARWTRPHAYSKDMLELRSQMQDAWAALREEEQNEAVRTTVGESHAG